MNTLSIPSVTDSYTPEQLYLLTEHWESDIAFFKDEVRFFRNLIDKYFIWMIEKDNLNAAQELISQIRDTDKKLEELNIQTNTHQVNLRSLVKKESQIDEDPVRNEHIRLENELVALIRSFRELKKKVFGLTEHVMESEKLRHLLNA